MTIAVSNFLYRYTRLADYREKADATARSLGYESAFCVPDGDLETFVGIFLDQWYPRRVTGDA